MKGQVIDEKRRAAASYVMGFYNDVQLLTHWYANYENLLIELQEKYGEDPAEKMQPDEKDVLKQYSQTLRYYAIKAQTSYVAIMQGIKEEQDKNINAAYATIKKQFVIKRADLETYVQALNGVLINTVIKNLLENSQDIVNQLYGETVLAENE